MEILMEPRMNCSCCGHPATCVLHGNDSLDVILEYDPDKNCVCCNHPECDLHDIELMSATNKPCICCKSIESCTCLEDIK